ncbi:MAG: rhodanese-like domain-containing protein [Planctomycetes bacterium]|nr:rhodanese-like domain-containing protein [Planctomycetota bacterium]
MRILTTVVVEVVIIASLGVGLGFVVNAARSKDSVKLQRDYFAKRPATTRPASTTGAAAPAATSQTASDVGASHGLPEHDYQVLSFEDVAALFEDPNTAVGANVFVDAREDDLFTEGHIPGALQCDHFRLERYIDRVYAAALQAEKVVVYCTGGECEDSIYVCGDLFDRGIEYEKIHLYPGGWEEWVEKQMPTESDLE